MDNKINFQNPNIAECVIYIGYLNDNIKYELLDIKFSQYGNIVNYSRPHFSYAFIQYDNKDSAINAVNSENNLCLNKLNILVKLAVTKNKENDEIYPINIKYFSKNNKYCADNSISKSFKDDNPHCEIIVMNTYLTTYAENIEYMINVLGINVNLMFPNDKILINKIYGMLQKKGCLYAIVVENDNMKYDSFTLIILHGEPEEHKNLSINAGIKLMYDNYVNTIKNIKPILKHQDNIKLLINNLDNNQSLTALHYECLIKYLEQKLKRDCEIGEDTYIQFIKKFNSLEKQVLSILNSKIIAQSLKNNSITDTFNPQKEEIKNTLVNKKRFYDKFRCIVQYFKK
jgi:hypothetical protein